MYDELIKQARELCEKATPGKWTWDKDVLITSDSVYLVMKPFYDDDTGEISTCIMPQDKTFIAVSHTLVPQLCDALEAVQKEIERLKFFAINAEMFCQDAAEERACNRKLVAKINDMAQEKNALTARAEKAESYICQLKKQLSNAMKERDTYKAALQNWHEPTEGEQL